MAFPKKAAKEATSKAVMTEEEDLPATPETATEETSEKAPKAKGGARSVVTLFPTQGKAVLKEGEETLKVAYHIRRKDQVELIAPIKGGVSVPLADWLAGKAQV